MVSRHGPAVYTIPVHRSFADALANGLIAQTRGDTMALARGMVLVPNNRAGRAVTDAFVRRADCGLLLPRIVAVGDVGDSETGLLFDDGGDNVPPAIDPMARRFILARLVQQERALIRTPVDAAEALRLADGLATVLDQLIAADVPIARLATVDVGALSTHWEKSLALLRVLMTRWPEELAMRGLIDAADRRNRLLMATAARWREAPPDGFVVVAGITTRAPRVAGLLDVVARMTGGQVVLPGVDLSSPGEEWDAIGAEHIESHPQHHLRALLDAIRVDRGDVKRWHWGDGRARPAKRSTIVAHVFKPAKFTHVWNDLPGPMLRLRGVRQANFATAADEAQGIAIALREALETPGKTAALITPDRALAERVVAHLKRWGIDADDSAGQPLSATPAGALILGVAQMAADRFAPVALLSVLKHPLVRSGDRIAWLDGVRSLDLALRGPRPSPGVTGLMASLGSDVTGVRESILAGIANGLSALDAAFVAQRPGLADLIAAVRTAVDLLAGDAAWSGSAGRAAGVLFDDLSAHLHEAPADFDAQALVPLLRTLMEGIAVRPPQGGHPRLSVWGLLEARLQTADLLVLGGLNEGVWPAGPAPDAWLSPKIRRELGIAGTETRVGLAAHDLATALGGREVLLTRARRDARSPTIASRFWLRIAAMTGGLAEDTNLVALAAGIDRALSVPRAPRPAPKPPVAIRPTLISVTDVDRLQADPFAFYAKAMLKLRPLDDVDADPDARWRGTAIHSVLDQWFRHDDCDPAKLRPRVAAMLGDAHAHPLLRALWGPRLLEAVEWIAAMIARDRAEGRVIVASECKGTIDFAGVRLHGRADRIDRAADGLIAVVDYKTGTPPSAKAVKAGFAMQLGLLGLIAERGGFDGVSGTPRVFEYWSLAKDKDAFGKRSSPVSGKDALPADQFLAHSARVFQTAADRWLTGSEPFTAKLVPEYAPYEDYDQLMRRDEWYGREHA